MRVLVLTSFSSFGYVEVGDVDAAVKLAGSDLDGRQINVDVANAPPAKREGGAASPRQQRDRDDGPRTPSSTVFLGNLSFDSNEDSIKPVMDQFGTVQEVRLVYDRETGKSRG